MSSSPASTMAVLGQAGDLYQAVANKSLCPQQSHKKRDGLCVSLLLLKARVVRRECLPCWGMSALWTASQNWQWQHSEIKAEIFVKHLRCPMSTGQSPTRQVLQDQPAFIFCLPHPAALVNGAGRAHCNIHVICACRAGEGGKFTLLCQGELVSLWGGRVTQSGRNRSVCWLVRSKWKGPC